MGHAVIAGRAITSRGRVAYAIAQEILPGIFQTATVKTSRVNIDHPASLRSRRHGARSHGRVTPGSPHGATFRGGDSELVRGASQTAKRCEKPLLRMDLIKDVASRRSHLASSSDCYTVQIYIFLLAICIASAGLPLSGVGVAHPGQLAKNGDCTAPPKTPLTPRLDCKPSPVIKSHLRQTP